MEIVIHCRKRKYLNVLETYYVFAINKRYLDMNDINIDCNPIFEIIYQNSPTR
jgi:hypothetical protein